jgi:hypothetical protein
MIILFFRGQSAAGAVLMQNERFFSIGWDHAQGE